jgi:hypothetical protein
MKRNSLIILVALALMALLISTYSQTPSARAVKKIQVTSQTLASLQAGKPYVVDLSRNGTVYNVASGVDYSRIQVRNAAGKVMTLSELINKAGSKAKKPSAGQPLVLGTVKNLRVTKAIPGRSPASRGSRIIACEGAICACTGYDDCIDMLGENGVCGSDAIAWCNDSNESPVCICIR